MKPVIRITATRTGDDEVVVRFSRSENHLAGGPEFYALGEGQHFTLSLYRAFVDALSMGVHAQANMSLSVFERDFGLFQRSDGLSL